MTATCPLCGRTVPASSIRDGVCDVWCAMQQPNDTMPARETAATIEAAMEHDPADTGTLPWRRDYVGRDRLQNRRR